LPYARSEAVLPYGKPRVFHARDVTYVCHATPTSLSCWYATTHHGFWLGMRSAHRFYTPRSRAWSPSGSASAFDDDRDVLR
jgi:hypothetical protein